ncbi:hypothetical protein GLAREA_01924 [Glarea lozoyensis ATCC 20868]|uniref:Uncharacterized protein n=1 Tax=Glarea lozoyensis (strain ATCC 20868 / MF5171) TaxID=1116229 RepID=S3CHR1_GLAL2|nr:uncharacterized protein GLAREA_01924 [Glarea lozoyensis ATCC 20868]EPE26012.1 hypothetical protein GLAREA_01924 [Glarea lozoyensis ATCC 20868]
MATHPSSQRYKSTDMAQKALSKHSTPIRKSLPRLQQYKRGQGLNSPKICRSEALTAWLAPQPLRERPRKAWQQQSLLQKKKPRRLALRSDLWRTWKISDFPEGEFWGEPDMDERNSESKRLSLIDEDESWTDSDLDDDCALPQAVSRDLSKHPQFMPASNVHSSKLTIRRNNSSDSSSDEEMGIDEEQAEAPDTLPPPVNYTMSSFGINESEATDYSKSHTDSLENIFDTIFQESSSQSKEEMRLYCLASVPKVGSS